MMDMILKLSSIYRCSLGRNLRQVIWNNKIYSFTAQPSRFFSLTPERNLKEVHVKSEDNLTVVEGVYVESERKDNVLKLEDSRGLCPICPHKLNMNVRYTDVLILSQFLRPDGCLLPRRVTGLCMKAQKRMGKLVHQAQRAGLLLEFRPDRLPGGKERVDDTKRSGYKWKKYNAFYPDDDTLK